LFELIYCYYFNASYICAYFKGTCITLIGITITKHPRTISWMWRYIRTILLLLIPRPSLLIFGAVNVLMRVFERQLCVQLRTGTRPRLSQTLSTTSCPVSACSWHSSTLSRTTTHDYHSESFSHWVTHPFTH